MAGLLCGDGWDFGELRLRQGLWFSNGYDVDPGDLSHIDTSTDPAAIISEVASASRTMREAYVDVIRVMLTTAPHDQAIAQQEQAATAIYRNALVPIADRLVQLGGLRPGIHAADAVDLLWFYFGYSSYFTLHDDNGWSYEQAERWLASQAITALLPPPDLPGRA